MTYPRLEILPHSTKLNHGVFKLLEDWEVELSNGYKLLVPKGYETDFASIPKFLHSFISPLHTGLREAGIVHDYLYDNWWELTFKGLPEARDRKWCDLEFVHHCKLNWRKWAMYLVLRYHPLPYKMYHD